MQNKFKYGLNNHLFFKKFNYQQLTQTNLHLILTHFSSTRYENSLNKIYTVGKTQLTNVINTQFSLIHYKLGLNFFFNSLQKGSRCWIIDTFNLEKITEAVSPIQNKIGSDYIEKLSSFHKNNWKKDKKKEDLNENLKYNQPIVQERELLLQKLSEFLTIRLQRRKNIHTAFLDYNLSGILTNHRWFSEQTESLEKNETLFHLLFNSRNVDKNELKQTTTKNYHSVRGLPFMPDLVITNKIFTNTKRVDLINEIKHTGIPLISLWDDLSFMNINYKICSNINALTQLFFTLLVTKIILKSIITRHYTFKIKSFIEKTNFKKKIFNTSLVTKKLTKKKEKTIIKKISFINTWLVNITKLWYSKHTRDSFKQIFFFLMHKFNLCEKLYIIRRRMFFTYFYYKLRGRWKEKLHKPNRLKSLKKWRKMYKINATNSAWFKNKWWPKKKRKWGRGYNPWNTTKTKKVFH